MFTTNGGPGIGSPMGLCLPTPHMLGSESCTKLVTIVKEIRLTTSAGSGIASVGSGINLTMEYLTTTSYLRLPKLFFYFFFLLLLLRLHLPLLILLLFVLLLQMLS